MKKDKYGTHRVMNRQGTTATKQIGSITTWMSFMTMKYLLMYRHSTLILQALLRLNRQGDEKKIAEIMLGIVESREAQKSVTGSGGDAHRENRKNRSCWKEDRLRLR